MRLFCVEISKINMLFSRSVFTYAPSDLIFFTTDVKTVLGLNFVYQSFWIEGWGNRNIDDDKCAKMPNFS